MKAIFSASRDPGDDASAGDDSGGAEGESMLFQKAYEGLGLTADAPMTWEVRFAEIGARACDPASGTQKLQSLWLKDSFMAKLGADAIGRMKPFMEFATAPANRDSEAFSAGSTRTTSAGSSTRVVKPCPSIIARRFTPFSIAPRSR